MFDWNDLRYFLAVVRSGSTVAAAKALGVNQSTIQRRLVALEDSVNQKLIERHPTGYRVSAVGRELLPYVEEIERAVSVLERRLESIGEDLRAEIRVTCPEGLVKVLMSPLVSSFQKKHPNLRVDLIVTERLLDLTKGEADIAVRGGEPKDGILIGRKLGESPWAVYGSRTYVEVYGRAESPEDINNHSIIDFGPGISNIHLAKWLPSVAPHARIAAQSDTMLGLVLAVKSGVGLASLPTQLGDAEPDVVRVIDPLPELQSPIYLLVHPDIRNLPRIRTFFEFVLGEAATYRPLLLGNPPPAA